MPDPIFELTPEESEQLAQFADPDEEASDNYVKWDEDLQREVLAMLMNDRHFLLESMALVKPSYFTNEVHQRVCGILYAHFNQFKTLPNKVQLSQELKEKLEGRPDEVRVRYFSELNSVWQYYVPNLESRDYYRRKIVTFAKKESFKKAMRRCVELLKNSEDDDTWLQIHEEIKAVQNIDLDFEEGLDYFRTAAERYNRKQENKDKGEVFTSGFKAIDEGLKNNGLLRGEMGSWMGLSGTGKSLALVTAALANLHLGKKVLYVTLEIDQDAVAERFDAQLANLKEQTGVTVNNLLQMKDIVINAIDDYTHDFDDKKLLVIKRFPSGALDVPSFRAYFSQIAMRGFRPDLVIIDYIGEMKDYPGIPTHESRFRITRDLRGFAVEEYVCLLTAMQPNKSAKEQVRSGLLMDDEHLGDSYAQVKPLDALWSINQLQDEKDCCLGRVNVAKHREGKSKYSFQIRFNYDTLAIEQISQVQYEAILKTYKNEKENRNSSLLKDALVEQALAKNKSSGKGPKLKGYGNDAGYDTNEPDAPEET